MTDYEKMVAGEPYSINDPELVEIRYQTRDKTDHFNQLSSRQTEEKTQVIKSIFKHVGENVHIEKGVRIDYGINTTLGNNVFINYNFVLLDCCPTTIGDNVFIAPNVQLYTAIHPLDPRERKEHIGQARPITIEDDVWIGGGCIILPGVTIGKGSTIGAGSVVNKSIPANSVAVGNPCKVVRSLEFVG
ncbi:sugar O-acetyltransferase [uncultured Vibrio sp.]|uniref:sugar O-acetyltransferase n=1 Tax=uncultured Vibrio sp. TaxID=114054 RepID=UPI0029C66F3D|nr:sugar O-acetyltransferase [uncultured Vibrio sp.]